METDKKLLDFAFDESKSETIDYLSKYWLENTEYKDKFKKLQQQLFSNFINDTIFNEDFIVKELEFGLLFVKESFESFKKFLKGIDNTGYFTIIEEVEESNSPVLKFVYPTDISWEEINRIHDGNILKEGVSYELFGRPVRNYFIFDESAQWGIYTALDRKVPIRLLGFHKGLKNNVNIDAIL